LLARVAEGGVPRHSAPTLGGKTVARQRIDALLDPGSPFLESANDRT